MKKGIFVFAIVFPAILVAQTVVDYRPPQKPTYYRPYKLFIGPTADVLPGGTFWLYGGAFFMNWSEYGIGQGVFNVGIADIVEVKMSVGRLLSNLSTGGANEFATAMRVKIVDTRYFKTGVELRLAPVIGQTEEDVLVVKDTSTGDYDYYPFTRDFRSRSATLFVPVTLYWGKFTFAFGGSITQYGTTIKILGDLPDTSDNCAANPQYDCEELKRIYRSPAFRSSTEEERSTFYGGYGGISYRWKDNTELIGEVHMLPRVIYRTRLKNTSDTLPAYEKWSLANRYSENGFAPVVLTFAGMRYSMNRYISVDAGIVLPYDPTRQAQPLDLLNAMIHANVNLIFSLSDIKNALSQ